AARRVGRVTIDRERRYDQTGDRGTRWLWVWSGPAMSRHNPVASRRRRLPYVAKIQRDDPFRPDDEREIKGMCKRIAAAGEYMVLAGGGEDAGSRVSHWGTGERPRAMQHWTARSGIAHRPMPAVMCVTFCLGSR